MIVDNSGINWLIEYAEKSRELNKSESKLFELCVTLNKENAELKQKIKELEQRIQDCINYGP